MAWTYEHDILLWLEILIEEPFRFKAGTREKRQVWDKIANNLNEKFYRAQILGESEVS